MSQLVKHTALDLFKQQHVCSLAQFLPHTRYMYALIKPQINKLQKRMPEVAASKKTEFFVTYNTTVLLQM